LEVVEVENPEIATITNALIVPIMDIALAMTAIAPETLATLEPLKLQQKDTDFIQALMILAKPTPAYLTTTTMTASAITAGTMVDVTVEVMAEATMVDVTVEAAMGANTKGNGNDYTIFSTWKTEYSIFKPAWPG
jgi:hypothetical protein